MKSNADIENIYTLTPMQKGMFYHHLRSPGSSQYFEQLSFDVHGEIDTDRFNAALTHLVERHEAFRTIFTSYMPDQPLQVVLKSTLIPMEVIDVSTMPADEQVARINAFKERDRDSGFDLEGGPLVRVAYFKRDAEYSSMVWSFHHIVMDGWCLSLMASDLFDIYRQLDQGVELRLAPVVSYGEYIQWLDTRDQQAASRYWQDTLAGYDQTVAFPLAKQVATGEFESGRLRRVLDSEVCDGLYRLSQDLHVTVNTLIQVSWGILLQRYNNCNDVVFGSVVSGRPADISGIETIIGLFINTIPVRVKYEDDTRFSECVRRQQEISVESDQYDFYPLYDIQNQSQIKNNLVNHLIAFENFPLSKELSSASEQGNLPFDIDNISVFERTNFDLNLIVAPGNEIEFRFEYNAKVHSDESIESMARHFEAIVRSVVSNPELRLSEIDILSPEEKAALISINDNTQVAYPEHETLVSLFEQQVNATPANIAVKCGEVEYSYAYLNERANRLAHTLRDEGVSPNQLVGLLIDRSAEMVVSILAVLKAGGAYLPIDPDYPLERINYLLNDSEVGVLLTRDTLVGDLSFAGTVVRLEESKYYETNGVNSDLTISPDSLAYVIYTSGTTGEPKGTMIEHRNVVRLLRNSNNLFDFNANDVWTLFHSYCFDFSVWEMFGALLSGGKLVVVPGMTAMSPRQFYELLLRESVTILNQTPGYFYRLQQEEAEHAIAELDIRQIIFGGEALRLSALRTWHERYPDTQLINMYGITETTVHVTYKEISGDDIESGVSTIGQPIPTLGVIILDPAGRVQPLGVSGEMYVSGAGLARGYLNRQALTDERFVPHPFKPGERLYRTGDRARLLPSGDIEYLGRMDRQVKLRGFRIELSEIESQLLQCTGVTDAVVLVHHRSDDAQLVAYATGPDLTVADIRAWMVTRLPNFMVPSAYVLLEEMPLTANGKVNRSALPEPDKSAYQVVAYQKPRNTMEESLVSLWHDVLGIPESEEKRIGIRDNFFELGGHSLKATTLSAKIHRLFDIELPLNDIFTYPTIEGIAERLSIAEEREFSKIPKAESKPYYALSTAQRRIFILSQLGESETSYNMSGALLLKGHLNKAWLEQCFQVLVERHQALRTSFGWHEGSPVQHVHEQVPFSIEMLDSRVAPEEFVRPFDLGIAPLIRVGLKPTDKDDHHLLVFDLHHIIADAAAMGILIKELAILYRGGELADLPIQYTDFSEWQNQQQQTETMARHEAYWLGQMGGELSVLDLPTDFTRPSVKTFDGARLTTTLDPETTSALKALAAENGATLYMVLLSAYSVLLSKYSGQDDILIGSPVANRTQAELDSVIGIFVNTLAMRTAPSGSKTYRDFLREIRQLALAAYEHQDYPFEALVEALNLSRDLSRNPVFDAMLILQNVDVAELSLSDLTMSAYELNNDISKFDITLVATESDAGLHLMLEYRTHLFKKTSMERWLGHFCQLLRSITAKPGLLLQDLEPIDYAERQQLLIEVNDTATAYPGGMTLGQLFEQQAALNPSHIALRFADAELSYGELNRQANRLAHALRQAGVGSGRVVGMLCDRSFAMVAATLGILKAGGAYLPIDPDYPPERQHFMLSDSDAQWLVLGAGQAAPNGFEGQVFDLDSLLNSTELADINPALASQATDLAYVMYTSGSTGTPKGIRTRHCNVSRVVKDTNYIDIRPDDCVLQLFNYVFDGATFDVYGALLNGATLRLVDREELLDARRLSARLRTGEISVFCITSALFNALVDWDPASLGFVRKVLFGGESVSVPHVRKALQHVSADTLIHVYGPTESTVFATAYPVSEVPDDATTVPIGTPIANTQVYVLDAGLRLQPLGVPGELCISGDGLAEGYLNQPERTAEAFVEHPFKPGERLYRTGDLARWRPDGTLEHLGRIDLQVKIRGHRIELGEIEHRLAHLSGVDDAIVIVRETGGDKHLCAFVTGRDTLALPTLRQQLATQLPDYMVPTYFEQLEAIPVTANGKADRNVLAERQGSLQTGVEFVAPRTDTEATLITLWREVLGLTDADTQPIGAHDHFFELGGHSLKATRLAAKIHREFDVELPLKDLFAYPTLEQQAHRIEGAAIRRFAAIPVAGHKPCYPLSSAQKRIYVLSQLEGGDINYNMPGAVVLEGELQENVLDTVLQSLVQRHEALRTSFDMVDGDPVQRVHDSVELSIVQLQPQGNASIAELARDFVRPFDLARAPLLRVGLVRLEEKKHLLLFDLHHIISDGATMGILIRDIAALYRGENLEPLRVQYKDFSEWQNRLFQSDDIVSQKAYWLDQFDGELPVLDMPTDFPRPSIQSFAGATLDFTLDHDRASRLKAFAQEQGTTLFMVLLSAYSLTLAKYSRQDDVIVGTPVAGRPHVDLESVMGMFVNTLALRSRPEAGKTYSDYLQEVKQQALDAFDNQDYPFEDLVEQLDLRRDLSRNPLFDVMFILQNNDGGELTLGDIKLTPYDMDTAVSKFDMTLIAGDTDAGLAFRLEYRTRLFTADTMARFTTHFQRLLDQLVEHPQQRLSDLSMLTPAERQQIQHDFNQTATAFPKDKTVQALFEEQVQLNPQHIAIEFGDELMTYQELNVRANKVARELKKRGVGAQQVVGLLFDRGFEMVVATLGVLKAGGVYLPVDPEYPDERIGFMLQDSGASWLLTQSDYEYKGPFDGERVLVDQVLANSVESGDDPEPVSDSADLAYIMYTSGSTGQPKGIKTRHYNISRVVRETNYIRFHTSDRVLQLSNYAFDGATFDIYGALLNGATLVLIPREAVSDIRRLSQTLVSERISVACITTALFNTLVDLAPQSLANTRKVLFGGESISVPHVRKALKQVKPEVLIHVYGPTESTVYATAYAVGTVAEHTRALPIGTPIANTEVYIMDDSLNLLPIGVPGELCISGAGLADGYLNRPELTQQAFVEHPLSAGERLYRTGDLAKWQPDGTVLYLGRIDQQVKIRGHRIEPGEVENRLIELADVKEACVLVREHADGEKYLCAYVTADAELDTAQLRQALAKSLPEYMLPGAWVQLASLPVTATGKLDRRALPEPGGWSRSVEYVAPASDVEKRLARLWQEVLGDAKGADPGIHDNFFELGGHSLKATALAARIHREFKVEVPLKEVFKAPTIAQLANLIDHADAPRQEAIQPLEKRPYYAVSPAQKSMYMLGSLSETDTRFNLPGTVILKGALDVDKLQAALNALVARHEPLRTHFEWVDDEPVQVVADRLEFSIDILAPVTSDALSKTALLERIQSCVRPFDLGRAPLFRVGLLPLAAEEHLLVFDVHHIVADGSTLGILTRELTAIFNGEPLPEVAVQYKDFAHWQRDMLDTGLLAAQEEYWLNLFSGELPVLELPADFERPMSGEVISDALTLTLGKPETERLNRIAADRGATLYMVLLAAYNILLAKYSGQDDIIVGSRIAGRRQAELESAIGLFVNTIALRNAPEGDKTYEQFLEEVKQHSLDAYEHQDYPFEELIEKLNLSREAGRSPLFSTLFSVQDIEVPAMALGNLELVPYDLGYEISRFDLTLRVAEGTDGMSLRLEYNTRLFKAGTIRQLLSHFKQLLIGIAEDPACRIANLPLLSDAEHQQLVHVLGTGTDLPQPEQTVHALFEAQVEASPEVTALVYDGQQLSYAELNARANQLAHRLVAEGVGPDRLVALMLDRSLTMVIGMLAVLKAGGAYVPIDPQYPEDRIRFILEDSETNWLLTQTPYRDTLNDYPGQVICIDDAAAIEGYEAHTGNLNTGVKPTHLVYVIYTSGTTGEPKGVLIEHRNVANLVTTLFQPLYASNPQYRQVAQLAPYVFDMSVKPIYGALLFGRTLHLVPEAIRADGQALHQYFDAAGIDWSDATPTYLSLLVNSASDRAEPSRIQHFIVGGEALSKARVIQLWQTLGQHIKLTNVYGPTECTVDATLYDITRETLTQPGAPIPIGHALPNQSLWILDRYQRLVPPGVTGEIYIGGAGVARGYLNRPDLTAEKFACLADLDGQRAYKTGDLGRLRPDGLFEYLGRTDSQVKIRGHRIELGEIESRLKQHGSVTEAVVIARDEADGGKVLCAYCVCTARETLPAELRQSLAQSLPFYMVPTHVVMLDSLPRNANGKLDLAALPKPELDKTNRSAAATPRDSIEAQLVALWQEMLNLDNIGITDRFFEIGGHSLNAIMLLGRIKKQFQVDIPLNELFLHPTIEFLADYIRNAETSSFADITPAQHKAYYALSASQRRLYLLEKIGGASTSYNMPVTVAMEGRLDRDRLASVFNTLVARHEALRTSFDLVDQEPVQKIHDQAPVTTEHLDLPVDLRQEDIHSATVKQAVATLLQAFIKPFDLEQVPMIRVGLVEKTETQFILIIDMHHIVSDAVTNGILVREFSELYNGGVLPELRIHYKDYSEWQQALFKSEEMDRQKAFWLNTLSGELPVLDLPTDFPRPPIQSSAGNGLHYELGATLSRKLTQLATETETTLYMVLLSAYSILLSRYSGQEDVIVGSPIAGRRHADLENVVGVFINTLAMRSQPAGAKPYRQYLQEIKQNALQAFDSQDYPFEELVEQLKVNRDPSRNPVFDTLFTLKNTRQDAEVHLDGLTLSPYEYQATTSKFDLSLDAAETTTGIVLGLEYCTDLFTRQRMERLVQHLIVLLEDIADNPDQPIARINLLTADERRQILTEFNHPTLSYPGGEAVHHRLENWALTSPDDIALVHDERQWTFSELNTRANQLARLLVDEGVGRDIPVALYMDRSPEMVQSILAVWKAGGCYVPVDPEHPLGRTLDILNDCEAHLVLTRDIYRTDAFVSAYQGRVVSLDAERDRIDANSERNLGLDFDPNQLAYVLYTSGSTGKPKGAMLEHAGMNNHIDITVAEFGLNRSSVIAQNAPHCFDISVWQLVTGSAIGARTVIYSNELILDVTAFVERVKNDRITVLELVVSYMSTILELDKATLPDVQHLLATGEPVKPDLVSRWFNQYPDIKLVNAYGPTEAADDVTFHTMSGPESGALVPVGRPLDNLNIYIVDPYMNLQPIGVTGELCVAGVGVGRGYLNRPELTERVFIEDPFVQNPGVRLYKTGDLANWRDDGNIEFHGRIDHQVKIRGHRIELGEIEAAIQAQHTISEVVVIVRQDGQTNHLCAYYVIAQETTASEIRQALARYLPDYMIPAYFMALPELPLTPNGKIDRKALPEPDRQVEPVSSQREPQGEVEQLLVEIWQSVLGLEQVGTGQSFFELGGDSIKGIQMAARLNQVGYKLDVKDLFQYPRIAELSRRVVPVHRLIDQSAVVGEAGLTPVQAWFFEQNFTEHQHWNQALMLHRKAGFRKDLLIEVLDHLVAHHDALRLVFELTDTGYRLRNRDVGDEGLYQFDHVEAPAGLDTDEAMRDFVAHRATEIQTSIDIHQGPLIRLGLFSMADGDHLLIAIHHLVIDGVSWRILLEDFATAYEQLATGAEVTLPPKTDAYLTWSRRLHEYASAAAFASEIEYWQGVEQHQQQALPKDRTPLQPPKIGTSAACSVALTEAETTRLLTDANKAYNTEINDLLMAGLSLAIAEWSGIGNVVVNLEGHGREHQLDDVDISRTVGWFTCEYPVVLEVRDEALAIQIKRVKESLHRVPNRGMDYGLLKYLSDREHGVAWQLRPEISFNYLGQFDENLQDSSDIGLSSHSTGALIGAGNERTFALTIVAMKVGGKLQINLDYCPDEYDADTMRCLTDRYRDHLVRIIDHCTAKESSELTPSDMTFKGLSMEALQGLEDQLDNLVQEDDL